MRPLISTVRVLAVAAVTLALVADAASASPTQYTTHGVVKSFGPKRAYVSIAHETIPGYMEAMTMSFEPRKPEQIGALDVGAKVALTFTATDDGHRLIDSITKE